MDETDAQHQPYWSELENIARPARERRRLPPEVRSQIIVELCKRAPLSVKDLSILLDRSEAYVGDAIRPLVTGGQLTFLYPEQPRHPRQKYMAAADAGLEVVAPTVEELVVVPEPMPYPEPAFRAAPPPTFVREPAPAAAQPEPAADAGPPRFPNQATNLVLVVILGVILALARISWWWIVAIVAALGIAALHVLTNSVQYRQFVSLRFLASKPAGFMMLKSAVAFAEIAIVFALMRALLGPE